MQFVFSSFESMPKLFEEEAKGKESVSCSIGEIKFSRVIIRIKLK